MNYKNIHKSLFSNFNHEKMFYFIFLNYSEYIYIQIHIPVKIHKNLMNICGNFFLPVVYNVEKIAKCECFFFLNSLNGLQKYRLVDACLPICFFFLFLKIIKHFHFCLFWRYSTLIWHFHSYFITFYVLFSFLFTVLFLFFWCLYLGFFFRHCIECSKYEQKNLIFNNKYKYFNTPMIQLIFN